MAIIGLSGGGPYALAVGAVFANRVRAIGILGGVAPTRGPDAIDGGLVALGVRLSWALRWGRVPLGMALGGIDPRRTTARLSSARTVCQGLARR